MPSFEQYQSRLGSFGRTLGEVRKKTADDIMLYTWDGDIASRVGYLYDYYNDENPYELNNLNPIKQQNKIPIDIKYIKHTSQTLDKDQVSYHIQMKPGQKCNVPYYEKYEDMYGIQFPLGLYCDIENESGEYNRWLIVAKADAESPQFPTYDILRCDYTFQYILDGKRMEIAGVLRSQNSYFCALHNGNIMSKVL